MGRLFGTDGIRGVAGVDLTDELMTRVAIAATRVFVSRRKNFSSVATLVFLAHQSRLQSPMGSHPRGGT